ncbi:MAG TPA: hypothetical protein VF143_07280, partial [Candidatus Nanopelagicales bacterium]
EAMSTDTRPSAAAQAPAQPERRWWVVGLLVAVGVIVAALGGFWLGRSTAASPAVQPTAESDPLASYAALPNPEGTPAIYTSGPEATFADASAVSITRDGQPVGNLATLTLVPGALIAINADPQALLRQAVSWDPSSVSEAIDMEVIGSTLLACIRAWGVPRCAWFADDSLNVFTGVFLADHKTSLGDQFLQDYLDGATRRIPTA